MGLSPLTPSCLVLEVRQRERKDGHALNKGVSRQRLEVVLVKASIPIARFVQEALLGLSCRQR